MKTRISALGLAVSAALLAGTTLAQTPDTDAAAAPAATEAARAELMQREVEAARAEAQAARTAAEVERAAREVAFRTVTRAGAGEPMRFNRFVQGGRAQLGLSLTNAEGGALVIGVAPGSPGETAGVRVGDVIQRIDDIDLTAAANDSASAAIVTHLADVEPGDTVSLAVERAGRTLTLSAEAAANPGLDFTRLEEQMRVLRDNLDTIVVAPVAPGAPGINIVRSLNIAASNWGQMELVPMTEGLARYFDTDEGLLVVRGPADDAIDIEDGDVILAIGGRAPNSPEHAIRILSSFEAGETIEFSIMRAGRRNTVEYEVPQSLAGAAVDVELARPTAD